MNDRLCVRIYFITYIIYLHRTFAVNVKSVLNLSQSVAKKMIEAKRPGSIVNVSSQASMVGLRDHITYCASKAALDEMTRCMALELGAHQVI